jgi:hypothetical protein
MSLQAARDRVDALAAPPTKRQIYELIPGDETTRKL